MAIGKVKKRTEKMAESKRFLSGSNIFTAAIAAVCLMAVGGYVGMSTVNAAEEETAAWETVQIGEHYWTKSRGNIVYEDGENEASFYAEDIRQLSNALKAVEDKAGQQGIFIPGESDDDGNPKRYSATASDVLWGKTFFNANKSDGDGTLNPGSDVGVMANHGGTAKSVPFTAADHVKENGKVQDADYEASGHINIPEIGYYDTDSELDFSLTDINRYYYDLGYTDGYADLQGSVDIEYVYHRHTDGQGNPIAADSVVYSTESPGGCYVGTHTHNKTGDCASHTTPGYLCTGGLIDLECLSESSENDGDEGNGNTRYTATYRVKCSACGAHFEHTYRWTNYDSSTGPGFGVHNEKIGQEKVYDCGEPANTWTVGCGKTEGTIESATIIFR